jgi:glyoxylase-like metal-dependent hydrolase (beta-lactamase superfamily II)
MTAAATKAFASAADLEEKKVTFAELAPGLYAYTAEGDPNSGIIVGDDGVAVVDAQATPVMARDVLARIRGVTDLPVTHVILSHYHAVRVLGASAYGAHSIVASQGTLELIRERGQQDWESELGRFPRLFRAAESVPGLTWPNLVFDRRLSLFLGQRELQVLHLGRGHTQGDTVVWLPREKVLYSGDLVEFGATPYCGDAHFRDWPATLDRLLDLGPQKLVPGRGEALTNAADCRRAIAGTRDFLKALFALAEEGAAKGEGLKAIYDRAMETLAPKYGHWVIFQHCMPFDVTRAVDEAQGHARPRIWTAERDREMWATLAG